MSGLFGAIGIVGTAILASIGSALVGAIIAYIGKAKKDSTVLISEIKEINESLKYQARTNSIQGGNISMLVRVEREHIRSSRSQAYALQELAEGNKPAAARSTQSSLDHLSSAEDDMETTQNRNEEIALGVSNVLPE